LGDRHLFQGGAATPRRGEKNRGELIPEAHWPLSEKKKGIVLGEESVRKTERPKQVKKKKRIRQEPGKKKKL